MHLNTFYRNLEEDGVNLNAKRDNDGKIIGNGRLAPKTVVEHHRLISKILNTAIKWQLIENNVASRADPPNVPKQEIKYLDEAQIKRFISLLEYEPIQYKTMIILLIYSGMRRGELCGLEWKDINFDTKMMKIVRSSQYIGNKTIITKDPKTSSGKRELMLSGTACKILQSFKVWQNGERLKLGDQWVDTDRLFTAWNGTPIYPDTISGWFADFIKKHDFPKVTMHSLRHPYVKHGLKNNC